MRIAMLAWESLHSISVGGVAAHVSDLSAALAQRGHQIHIFTRRDAHQAEMEKVGDVWYHRCRHDEEHDFPKSMDNMCNSFLWHLRRIEDLQGRSFDIVHGHDWLCAKGVIRAKNEQRNRAVLTMHSTEFGRSGNADGDPRIGHIEWEGMYCADRVIAVSKTLAAEVVRLHQVPTNKMSVVYNGVFTERFEQSPAEPRHVRERLDIGPRDPVVLFVGRLAWQKGPDILLHSIPGMLSHHPDAKFVFVGDGEMRRGLEDATDRLDVRRAVRFVGKRRGNELVGLFHFADVLAVPSRNEPFGIVILEGWAAGKPVVAVPNGGPAEFVRHGHNGLLVFDKPDSICWGIGSTLMDGDFARRLGSNGRDDARNLFAWDVIAERTEEIYRGLL